MLLDLLKKKLLKLSAKNKELSEKVGITQTVGDVGGKVEDIPMLADKAMEDPCKPEIQEKLQKKTS